MDKDWVKEHAPSRLRGFVNGEIDVGGWVYLIIIVVVLFALVAGLYQTFYTNVSDLGNVTGNPFGSSFSTIILLLLFAALLLAVVGAFLHKTHMGGGA